MTHWKLFAAIALLAIVALHCATIPRSIWEFDESLFVAGVEQYEPLLHHPPPPGYPLYIGFAKLVAVFTPDAFTALLATSVIAVALGFLVFVLAFATITDLRTGVVAAVLLYGSPAVLISGTLPQSDAGALALLGLAIWGCTREKPALCGLFCAIAIGWRLQLSIAIVPMFLAAVVMMRSWRDRAIAVSAFGLACVAWFVPLVMQAGGPESYWKWLSGQAKYYAAHDADLSRSGQSAAHIALRFIAHPWGPKFLSLPLLVLAIAGIRRNRRLIPLAAGGLVYLGFALATMDPADAVRYAIPSLPLIALLAATTRHPERSEGVGREGHDARAWRPALPGPSLTLGMTCLYVLGSIWYALPVLRARATSPSPPAAAIRWIEANVPKHAIVLYDPPLWPHASVQLDEYKTMRIDAGLAQYGGDPSVPMVIFADGERADAKGVTFRWADTDAYRKLTREHYGAVSVIPLPPAERYRVIEGVFAPERTRDGRAWRWLGSKAILEVPSLGATRARLVFRTPPEYPLDQNRIRVNDSVVAIKRNETVEVIIPITDTRITITPERTFVPAQIRGANNRDQRTLSVMLTRVELLDRRPAAAGSPPPR
ncbi:MAG TPA: hypothetical protein VGQ76_24220 [Thermoanaerobaculia bacterium]|nr:hypothetical protein [Thermoanaerobaculia bacterium]